MVQLDTYRNILRACESHGARLVAVSKTQPAREILKLYEAGQRIFGENKVQELTVKQNELPDDIEWHLIGHLQRNKVRQAVPLVSMIQSLDSLKLAREINKQAADAGRHVPVLLQLHIASESTKYGFGYAELEAILAGGVLAEYPHLTFCGVMGMATFTDRVEQVRTEFRELRRFFERIRSDHFTDHPAFCEVSMGMSGDYRIALEEGSTLVRIGSALFGARH